MISFLVIVVSCALVASEALVRFPSVAKRVQAIHASQKSNENENSPIWKITEDSSEIMSGSSSDFQNKQNHQRGKEEEQTRKHEEPTSASTNDNTQRSSSTAMSPSKNSAFDIGLFIAFPFIIGTLALFFLFPIIGPEFGKSLPPPMSY